MLNALENEQRRHENWAGALTLDLDNDKLTAVERDTLQRSIRQHKIEAAAFGGAYRAIERVRCDSETLARWRRLDEAEHPAGADDDVRYE
jgi:hypothetical protein